MRGARGAKLTVALSLVAALAPVHAEAELVAERIDATNAERTIVGVVDAAGGIDDWALQNGTVCAVVSGELVETRRIEPGGPVAVPLTFAADAFVTTEIRGETSEAFAAVLPRHEPFAFTNPIWVDADGDGDGAWTAPGHASRAP